jgi:hypothetical protein
VDNNANNFAVGAIVSQYGDIYIFGKNAQPFVSKLTGASPSAYSLPPIFQKVYAAHKTAFQIINDIWFGNESGIDSMGGVEQYGDLRTFSESDPMKNVFDTYWNDDDAFAGYNAQAGQYILKLPDYLRCLVCHVKRPVNDNVRGRIRYPWTEYLFIRDDLTDSATYQWTASGSGTNEYYLQASGGGDPSISSQPAGVILDDSIITEGTAGSLTDHQWDYGDNDSLGYSTIYVRDDSGDPDSSGVEIRTILKPTSFANYDNKFFVGCDDGFIYYLDSSVTQDNSKDISFILAGKLHEIGFKEICLDRYHIMCESDGSGSTFHFLIFNNDVDIDDLHSNTPDADFTVTVDTRVDGDINFNVLKFMCFIKQLDPNGSAFRLNQIALEAISLGK